ncbi:ABC transporter permease [soil metagenome]
MTIELRREADDVIDARIRHVRRFGAWYVVEHLLRVTRGYAAVVIATGIGTPLIYLFSFGVGLAALVSSNLGPNAVDGVSYLQFVAPALLCTAAVTVASSELTYPIMLGFKWNPIYFGMNAAPLSGRQIIDGTIIFVVIRTLFAGLIYYLVMLLFGAISAGAGLGAVIAGVLTGLGFGMPLLAYSASVTEDKGQFAVVMRVIVLPLSLFSGTVFPLSQLPIYLQWLGWLSPLWHGTELARQFSYGPTEPIWLTVVHVAYLVALSLVGWRLAVRITTRRLDK